MYEIKALTCGVIGNNTYMIKVGNKAILIDPAEYSPIKFWLDSEEVSVAAILLTHGHFDHIAAVFELKAQYNCDVYCHQGDFCKCQGIEMSERMIQYNIKPFTPDIDIAGKDNLEILGLNIGVMHTPGHSIGSVCYILDRLIFCGDTLFKGSYGRYDFYDGSLATIKASIAAVFALEGDYTLYSGHGAASHLVYERKNNDILWS